MKKLFMLLFMLFVVSGCNNEECECPQEPTTSEKVYQNVVSDYSELYKKTATSVVKIVVTQGTYEVTGSGVVFYEMENYAYILTNAHVVQDVNSYYEVEVIFSNEDGYESGESEIVHYSKIYKNIDEDVAVLEIPSSDKYTIAELGDSSKISKGDFVYTIGSPFGKFNYTTSGNISSYNVPATLNNNKVTSYVIVSDAVINKGNSGGALFNEEGKLIGITTLRYDLINNEKVQGMYGSLPINHVVKIARKIMTGQTYIRPKFGYNFVSVNEMGADRVNYGISPSITSGVYVSSGVDSGSNLLGYVITEVNQIPVRSVNDFYAELFKYDIGATISLTVVTKDNLVYNTLPVVLHS